MRGRVEFRDVTFSYDPDRPLIESLSLFWIPAKEASVPNLVPPAHLESANRLSLITTYGSARWAETSEVRRAGLRRDTIRIRDRV